MEEGARGVDELADGRGRSAGDEPEDLLRADPAYRGAWDPRGPPGRGGSDLHRPSPPHFDQHWPGWAKIKMTRGLADPRERL